MWLKTLIDQHFNSWQHRKPCDQWNNIKHYLSKINFPATIAENSSLENQASWPVDNSSKTCNSYYAFAHECQDLWVYTELSSGNWREDVRAQEWTTN